MNEVNLSEVVDAIMKTAYVSEENARSIVV